MLTPLGKMMRKLRIDQGEKLFDIAKALGVTPSFVSAVELGSKSATSELLRKVIAHYRLEQKQADDLLEAARLSKKDLKIELIGKSDKSRELAVAFARQFPTLDEVKIRELLGFLREGTKDERHRN